MRGIICESCREEIDPIVPFLEVRPNGLTAFMRAKDLTPKSFCSFRCLAEWAKRQSGGEMSGGGESG